MSQLIDCPSCGGLLPAGRRCCPHCHCNYPVMKRWWLLIAAAVGIGAAGCDDHHTAPVVEYGPPILQDASVDAAPDLGNDDGGH
jgi:hypothetical protein